ncbi:hypothetical protein C8F04DRAFT_1065480 [Mycena alexandri]|uniref:Secreted protein n=1 Tax=Mycena alexandri TaxID=1745969 RepID=A0AAD6TGG0_9AGAR|nr:hypothetical protein C8F04DRAFT_1065480 [Mycena alexandri]
MFAVLSILPVFLRLVSVGGPCAAIAGENGYPQVRLVNACSHFPSMKRPRPTGVFPRARPLIMRMSLDHTSCQ